MSFMSSSKSENDKIVENINFLETTVETLNQHIKNSNNNETISPVIEQKLDSIIQQNAELKSRVEYIEKGLSIEFDEFQKQLSSISNSNSNIRTDISNLSSKNSEIIEFLKISVEILREIVDYLSQDNK